MIVNHDSKHMIHVPIKKGSITMTNEQNEKETKEFIRNMIENYLNNPNHTGAPHQPNTVPMMDNGEHNVNNADAVDTVSNADNVNNADPVDNADDDDNVYTVNNDGTVDNDGNVNGMDSFSEEYVPLDLLDELGDVDGYKPDHMLDGHMNAMADWLTLKTMSMIHGSRVIGLPRKLEHEVQVNAPGAGNDMVEALSGMVTSILNDFPYAGDDEPTHVMLAPSGVWVFSTHYRHGDDGTVGGTSSTGKSDADTISEMSTMIDETHTETMLSVFYTVSRIAGREDIPFYPAVMEWSPEQVLDEDYSDANALADHVNGLEPVFTDEELDLLTTALRNESNWFEAYNDMAQEALNQMFAIAALDGDADETMLPAPSYDD